MIITDKAQLMQVCEPIVDIAGEGMFVIDKLQAELAASPIMGIGLAAPQISISKRAFVMQIMDEVASGSQINFAHNFINPVIVNLYDPISFKEGCLSFPGEEVETLRYNRVVVLDALEPSGRTFEGLAAVCVQHETAHLDGLLMHDFKLSSMGPNDKCKCGSDKKYKACCRPKLKRF